MNSGWDFDLLIDEMEDLDFDGFDFGFRDEELDFTLESSCEEIQENQNEAHETLKEKFLMFPSTILDARTGEWLKRKKMWEKLGLASEKGRGNDGVKGEDGLTFSISSQPPNVYTKKNEYEKKINKKISWKEFSELFPDEISQCGTSIFDPVLCEVLYRWFSPIRGRIIDPFAGGSVRGIVAALLGRNYTGVDLSERQIKANIENWGNVPHESIIENTNCVADPQWIIGDSMNIQELVHGKFDFMFSCPPYGNLEVYSDKKEDISNKDYPEFLELYSEIINRTCQLLNNDSFACFVVSEIRGKNGAYLGFVNDTIKAFEKAWLEYYNEVILINQYGSLPVRINRQFTNSRKLGRTHQNILCFIKGDARKATGKLEKNLDDMNDFENEETCLD